MRLREPASRTLPADRAIASRPPGRRRRPRDLLGGMRQSRRQAGGIPARRAGRRLRCESAAFLRPGALSHRAVRPARLRPQPPACEPREQHDLGPRRRHRAAAHDAGHRALAGVRRLVGLDARPRLRRGAPGTRERAGPARHLPAAQARARLVLPVGRLVTVSRSLGGLPRADPARGARRPRARVPPAAHGQRRCRGPGRRARLVGVGRLDELPADRRRERAPLGRGCVRARGRAHRVPLLHQPRLPGAREPAPRRRRPHPSHPGGDRAGPARRRLPDGHGLGPAPRLAGSGTSGHRRRRPLRFRARHHRRAGTRDGPLRSSEPPSPLTEPARGARARRRPHPSAGTRIRQARCARRGCACPRNRTSALPR